MEVLVVGLGGFVGAVARYSISGWVQARVEGGFPLGTLAVNLIGCALLGALMTLVKHRQLFTPEVRLFVAVGLLGSMTTFSTFGYETLELWRGGEWRLAAFNVAGNVVLGLAGVLLGRAAVRILA